MRNLLEHATVTCEESQALRRYHYRAELRLTLNWMQDLALRQRQGSSDIEAQIGHLFASQFYRLIFEEIYTRLQALYPIAISAASPAYRNEITHRIEELFALVTPTREEVSTMTHLVAQALRGNAAQSYTTQEVQAPQAEQQQAAAALFAGGRQRGWESQARSVPPNQWWEALVQHAWASRDAQRPEQPPEDAPPGYLHEEEDIGDNVIDDGLDEVRKFVREFRRDVGGSDDPDPA